MNIEALRVPEEDHRLSTFQRVLSDLLEMDRLEKEGEDVSLFGPDGRNLGRARGLIRPIAHGLLGLYHDLATDGFGPEAEEIFINTIKANQANNPNSSVNGHPSNFSQKK